MLEKIDALIAQPEGAAFLCEASDWLALVPRQASDCLGAKLLMRTDPEKAQEMLKEMMNAKGEENRELRQRAAYELAKAMMHCCRTKVKTAQEVVALLTNFEKEEGWKGGGDSQLVARAKIIATSLAENLKLAESVSGGSSVQNHVLRLANVIASFAHSESLAGRLQWLRKFNKVQDHHFHLPHIPLAFKVTENYTIAWRPQKELDYDLKTHPAASQKMTVAMTAADEILKKRVLLRAVRHLMHVAITHAVTGKCFFVYKLLASESRLAAVVEASECSLKDMKGQLLAFDEGRQATYAEIIASVHEMVEHGIAVSAFHKQNPVFMRQNGTFFVCSMFGDNMDETGQDIAGKLLEEALDRGPSEKE